MIRAFTTAAYAFGVGATAIYLVATVEQALAFKAAHPDVLAMGEDRGRRPEGFDFPNSPAAVSRADLDGRTLVQRTSAGTQGVVAAVDATRLWAASLVCASATARAVTPTEVRVIGRAGFDQLRLDHPAFDLLLIELLDQRLKEVSDLLMDARHRPAEDRVRRTIRHLARLFGDEIPLSQEVVASLAGTTRPTVNSIVRGLEDDGAVELARGRLRLLDVDAI